MKSILYQKTIWMAWSKRVITPLLIHWCYRSLALSHCSKPSSYCMYFGRGNDIKYKYIITFYSLAPGRHRCHFKTAIFNLVLLIGIFTSSNYNALRWMPRDLPDDKSTLVLVMTWCRQATSHYLSQCWPSSMSPIDITRPQWVNLLWLSDWHWRAGSTLVQVMACCQTPPSHCLNQCWFTMNEILWHSFEGIICWIIKM